MKSKTESIISFIFVESMYGRVVRARALPGVMIVEEKKREETQETNWE